MNITWDADQNFEKSSLYHLHRGITTVKGRIGGVILTNNREPAKKWCVEPTTLIIDWYFIGKITF